MSETDVAGAAESAPAVDHDHGHGEALHHRIEHQWRPVEKKAPVPGEGHVGAELDLQVGAVGLHQDARVPDLLVGAPRQGSGLGAAYVFSLTASGTLSESDAWATIAGGSGGASMPWR